MEKFRGGRREAAKGFASKHKLTAASDYTYTIIRGIVS
jgi:hypothetical protein